MNFYTSAILAAIERDSVFYIFFGAILQNFLIFGTIPLILLILYLIGSHQAKKDKKIVDEALRLKEKGNLEEAYEIYKPYLENGAPSGEDYYLMATLCREGKKSGWKHYEKEYCHPHWLKLAAEEGYLPAKFELANEKFEEYYPKNMARAMNAVDEIRALCKEGSEEAKEFIREFERKTAEVRKKALAFEKNGEYEEAYSKFTFFLKHIKAEGKDYYRMAEICKKGKEAGWNLCGKEYNFAYWLEKAADKGYNMAKFELLRMDFEKNYPNNIFECAKIVDKIKSIGEKGLDEAKIFFHELEKRIEKDYRERNFDFDFNLFDRFAILYGAESWMQMGMHLEEEGKIKKAMEWYALASEKNNAEAEFSMALIYLEGRPGVPADYEKGVEWLEKAAKNGETGYKKFLAKLYISGETVKQDYAKAADWFVKAGEDGDAESYHQAYLCLNTHAMKIAHEKGLDTFEKFEADEEICEYLNLACIYEERAKEMGYVPEK
ncbi:MAG: sel1 repeat family protein [Oscillospiraceae bacterium]|nr:sel1 repeat family protein [Oscillospiraceae bacterium]